jgi:hypothetical protein
LLFVCAEGGRSTKEVYCTHRLPSLSSIVAASGYCNPFSWHFLVPIVFSRFSSLCSREFRTCVSCEYMMLSAGSITNAYAWRVNVPIHVDADCAMCVCNGGVCWWFDGDSSSQTGSTALIWAAANGHTECVRLLIDAGADTEAQIAVR